MTRLAVASLVLALSGVPAAEIVCDVLLCTVPAQSAPADAGCHEHGTTAPAPRLTASGEECSHLSIPDPYVAPALRLASHPAAAILTASIFRSPLILVRDLSRTAPPGSGGVSAFASSVPLRI